MVTGRPTKDIDEGGVAINAWFHVAGGQVIEAWAQAKTLLERHFKRIVRRTGDLVLGIPGALWRLC